MLDLLVSTEKSHLHSALLGSEMGHSFSSYSGSSLEACHQGAVTADRQRTEQTHGEPASGRFKTACV